VDHGAPGFRDDVQRVLKRQLRVGPLARPHGDGAGERLVIEEVERVLEPAQSVGDFLVMDVRCAGARDFYLGALLGSEAGKVLGDVGDAGNFGLGEGRDELGLEAGEVEGRKSAGISGWRSR